MGQGDPIKVRELEDEHAEARFVTGEIQRLVDEGISRSEIAVFYRTNAQSRVLEDTLVRADIAYQVVGGTKFYERAEIKDAIAYLITLIVNPQDVGAFTRIVNSPRARDRLDLDLAAAARSPTRPGASIWDAASEPEQVPGLGDRGRQGAAAVHGDDARPARARRVRRAGRGAAEGGAPRDRATSSALEAERTIEAQGRLENLEELVNVAAEYDASDAESATRSPSFLQQISLRSDADERTDDEGLVTLMTLHNAKGLEYRDRVHDRLRGGRLPALARARRGRARGGAPALLRRHHPRRSATCTSDLRAHPQRVRRPHLGRPEPLHRRDPRGS